MNEPRGVCAAPEPDSTPRPQRGAATGSPRGPEVVARASGPSVPLGVPRRLLFPAFSSGCRRVVAVACHLVPLCDPRRNGCPVHEGEAGVLGRPRPVLAVPRRQPRRRGPVPAAEELVRGELSAAVDKIFRQKKRLFKIQGKI